MAARGAGAAARAIATAGAGGVAPDACAGLATDHETVSCWRAQQAIQLQLASRGVRVI